MEKELTRYALKSGYLEKVVRIWIMESDWQGHFRKTWKKRLFVLTSSEISYIDVIVLLFVHYQGEVVKGKIPLEMITDLEKTEVDDRSMLIVFCFADVQNSVSW